MKHIVCVTFTKQSNKIAKAIKAAVIHSPKILLTATPLQNSLLELYRLVSIIDEYAFGDLKSFKAQFARLTTENNFDELKRRLEPICKRTRRRQVLEYINYTNRTCILQEFTPRKDEQKSYDLVSEYLQRDDLYALPPGQRKLMTLILRKLLASSTYAISATLQGLANRLDATITKHESSLTNVEEVFTDNYEAYEEQQDEWVDDDENDETEPERIYITEEIGEIKKEIEALNESPIDALSYHQLKAKKKFALYFFWGLCYRGAIGNS